MKIGVDPIGGIPFDYEAAELSQFANSPILLSLISSFSGAVDPKVAIDNFYDDVWNIATCGDYGLKVWGEIVGIGRTVQVTPRYFGFEEMGDAYIDPYNNSPYYSGDAATNAVVLAPDAYRQLIMAKAAANIWDGSILGLNQILALLFPGRGAAYVTDGLDQTMTYTFEFALTPVEIAVITTTGVLPQPQGVVISYVIP